MPELREFHGVQLIAEPIEILGTGTGRRESARPFFKTPRSLCHAAKFAGAFDALEPTSCRLPRAEARRKVHFFEMQLHDRFPPTPVLSYFAPPAQAHRPAALVVVAWLFIAAGALAIVEMAIALFESQLKLDFGALQLFVGLGLLRYKRGWRTLGLVFIWIAIILLPIGILALLGIPLPAAQLTLAGKSIPINSDVARLVSFLSLGAMWIAHIWAYRVLTRPDVRRLFGL
jgi:hypothetical protein